MKKDIGALNKLVPLLCADKLSGGGACRNQKIKQTKEIWQSDQTHQSFSFLASTSQGNVLGSHPFHNTQAPVLEVLVKTKKLKN